MIKNHLSYIYASNVVNKKVNAPKYVIIQCKEFLNIADGNKKSYVIDENKVKLIDELLKLMIMPSGLKRGLPIYECTIGYQWMFYVSTLCVMHKENILKRKYEKAILEISRKNFKTFTIAVEFLLLFFLEPKFSKFFSVAPDGSLSREIQDAIKEIIGVSPALGDKFKVLRDYILCKINDNKYTPLNYSNSRLDARKPSVFLIDEVGALPNNYAIEAMASGQTGLFNKLGCIISTKYPTFNNPFEDEVAYAKKVLDGILQNEKVFALLYEPDNTKDWESDDEILEHSNPAGLEIPVIMQDVLDKRQEAIDFESKRENFVTKHCNIIYQGVGTESYISIDDLQKGRVNNIDWTGRNVYLGADLAMTNDNCSIAMTAHDESTGDILGEAIAFIPEGRIDQKNKFEGIDYREFIKACKCISCGDMTVDYGVIEEFVFNIEKKYAVNVIGLGFDRYNALSSAQKWEKVYNTVEVKQHSDTLHMPTKLLAEKISEGKFIYETNKLLEINFQNAQCTFDTTLRRFVNKKRSKGKVDMVVALIIAIHLLQQNELLENNLNWGVQIF